MIRVILCLLIIVPLELRAQEKVTPTTSSTPSVKVGSQEELAQLELTMAETLFASAPNLENRSAVLAALERLVSVTCFANLLQKLSYVPPAPAGCQRYLGELLRQYPENPVAICARDGIDAPSCIDAFAQQTLLALETPDLPVPKHVALDLKLHMSKNATRIEQVESEINTANQTLAKTGTPEAREALNKALGEMLALQCKVSQLVIRELAAPPPRPTPVRTQATKPALDDPALSDIDSAIQAIRAAAGMTPQAAERRRPDSEFQDYSQRQGKRATGPFQQRVRLLPKLCIDHITQVLAFNPAHPAAICYRDSFVAPSCIQALRTARQTKTSGSAGPRTPAKRTDGLATF